jgi:hypothetical protein
MLATDLHFLVGKDEGAKVVVVEWGRRSEGGGVVP